MSSDGIVASPSAKENTMSFSIKFLPFASTVESPFWVQYCHQKLNEIKLSEDPIPITATYTVGSNRLQLLEADILPCDDMIPNDRVVLTGHLQGWNTLESFSKLDKNQYLQEQHQQNQQQHIQHFHLMTYADLKQHKVLFWFAFPALKADPASQDNLATPVDLPPAFDLLVTQFQTFRRELAFQRSYSGLPPYFCATPSEMILVENNVQEVLRLWNSGEPVLFGYIETAATSTTTNSTQDALVLGWPLRNLLAYLSQKVGLGGQQVTFVSWRAPLRRLEKDPALLDHYSLSPQAISQALKQLYTFQMKVPSEYTSQVVGWETNARQKPGPRWVNLQPLLDPTHLAIQAADLNLKLMKWRMIPSLNIDMLQRQKVLLLGAGTLGCSVARTLLGWGIRQITMLDYGRVSYSNPVRQNLFTLDDCHYENRLGKPKAQAAVDALKQIAADVNAEAVHWSIPMPGHAESKESIQDSVTKLDTLIRNSDVIFLLTDTRESRWLPTLMAAAHGKMMINAALGLDSWLVMRHGGPVIEGNVDGGTRLGCYFCNDVVAPENSTKNRTLDQQCTVTRPGLAPIAASMAVELMVALLHHPLQQRALAPCHSSNTNNYKDYNPAAAGSDDDSTSALGVMPHQIRGSLVSYQMMTPTVPAFDCCTACSPSLIQAYLAGGDDDNCKVDLVHQVCQSTDSSFLEDLTGLTAFRTRAAEQLAAMEDDDGLWDDDDDEVGTG